MVKTLLRQFKLKQLRPNLNNEQKVNFASHLQKNHFKVKQYQEVFFLVVWLKLVMKLSQFSTPLKVSFYITVTSMPFALREGENIFFEGFVEFYS